MCTGSTEKKPQEQVFSYMGWSRSEQVRHVAHVACPKCSAFHFLHNQSVFSIVLHNQSVFSMALLCTPICMILLNQLVCSIVMFCTSSQYLIYYYPARPISIMYYNILAKKYSVYCSSAQPVRIQYSVFCKTHTELPAHCRPPQEVFYSHL